MLLPPEFTFIQRGYFNGNNILLQGSGGPVIIDSGHLFGVDETLELIRGAGVDPADLTQIVSTHAHSDHHGANQTLKRLSGAPVILSEMTHLWFSRGEQELTWFDQVSQEVDIVTADITVRHGDRITLSGMDLEVIGLPGHAPDCVGFYQPDTKVLICADAMWENDLGVVHTALHGQESLDLAELAVRRIMALDVKIAIPGHGNLITDPRQAARNVLRRIQTFQRDPKKHAQHLYRRLTMFSILRYQPILRRDFIDSFMKEKWVYSYLDEIWEGSPGGSDKIKAKIVFNQIIDEFVERGVVKQSDDGILTTDLPK